MRSQDTQGLRSDFSRFVVNITAENLDDMKAYAGQNFIGKIWKLSHNANAMPTLNQIQNGVQL